MKPFCQLTVIEGPASGERRWLRRDQNLSIGRISTADFPIPFDLHLSRNHILIEGTSDGFRIRDVGSTNGTYVNGNRISVMTLCESDQIKAGKTVILVSLADAIQIAENFPANSPAMKTAPTAPMAGDLEETNCYSGSWSDNLPRRSLNAPPGEQEKLLLPDFAPAGHRANIDERVNEGSSQPSISTAEKSLAKISSNGFHFDTLDTSGLFGLQIKERKRDIANLLNGFETGYDSWLVCNKSQLSKSTFALVDGMVTAGIATPISQSLVLIRVAENPDAGELIRLGWGLDAIIVCVIGHHQCASDLGALADILSFPSMFRGLIKQPDSPMRKKLAEYAFAFLFPHADGTQINLLFTGGAG